MLREIAIDIIKGKLPKICEEDLQKRRIEICENCGEFTKFSRQCKQCGCFMDVKSKILIAECPLKYW